MKKILILIAMMIGIMPLSAQEPQTLEQVSKRINAKCPMEISDGMVLSQADNTDGQFMFSYTISDEMFDNISTLGGILHDSMLAEMESSPDPIIKSLTALCKATKTKIVQRFNNSTGQTFDITILPSEL